MHSFLHCQEVETIWNYLIQQIPGILTTRTGAPEDEWLNLSYEETGQAKSKLYVIGQTIQFIHHHRKNGQQMEIDPLRSWLKTANSSRIATENNITIDV